MRLRLAAPAEPRVQLASGSQHLRMIASLRVTVRRVTPMRTAISSSVNPSSRSRRNLGQALIPKSVDQAIALLRADGNNLGSMAAVGKVVEERASLVVGRQIGFGDDSTHSAFDSSLSCQGFLEVTTQDRGEDPPEVLAVGHLREFARRHSQEQARHRLGGSVVLVEDPQTRHGQYLQFRKASQPCVVALPKRLGRAAVSRSELRDQARDRSRFVAQHVGSPESTGSHARKH